MFKMRVAVLLVAALVGFAAAGVEVEHYRGHKLLTVFPKEPSHLDVINALGKWRDVDIFTHRVAVGKKVVVMMPPASLTAAEKVLAEKGVAFEITNHDVQESVVAERRRQEKSKGRAVQVLPTYERYMRYAEIKQFLTETAKKYPDLVLLESAGQSFQRRDMPVVRISKTGGQSARSIVVDAGIHAREWISPPVAIYLIQQLTEMAGDNAALLDDLDWYIMPLANPDGYEYTHTKERMWRKNRSDKNSRWCPGTDLNRNFGFHYRESGASDWPCDETYAGPTAFSEIEAVNLRDWILKSNAKKNAKLYLTFHSYGPAILYPYGYANDLPDLEDKDELVSIADEANEAMVAAGSERFEVENSAGLYPAAGASDDWSRGVAGIKKVYTVELPGGGHFGFDLPSDRIIGVVQSVFEGIKVWAARAKKL